MKFKNNNEEGINPLPLKEISEGNGVNTDEISLRELILKMTEGWRYLLSKWLIITIVGIIGGLAGLAYALNKKPVYKAELSFVIEDDKGSGGLGGALGLASQFGFDLGGGTGSAFSGENLLELMKSRAIVEKTLLTPVVINSKKQTFAELYIDFNGFRKKWAQSNNLKDIKFPVNADPSKFTLQQDSILGVFHKSLISDNLFVDKLDKKLSIVTVQVISSNELFSKEFAEILVKNVSDFYIETKTKKSTENVNILQHQADSIKYQLYSAISGVALAADANPNPNPSRQVLRVSSQRSQVNVEANKAILTELVKNLEISKVSLRKETPLIQIIDSPILPLEKIVINKIYSAFFGCFLSVFFLITILSIQKLYKHILSE